MHTLKVNVNFMKKAAFSEAAFLTKVYCVYSRYFVHV